MSAARNGCAPSVTCSKTTASPAQSCPSFAAIGAEVAICWSRSGGGLMDEERASVVAARSQFSSELGTDAPGTERAAFDGGHGHDADPTVGQKYLVGLD